MQVQMGTVQEMAVQVVQETISFIVTRISLKNHQKSHLIPFLLQMTIKMWSTIDMNNNKSSKNRSGIIVQIK